MRKQKDWLFLFFPNLSNFKITFYISVIQLLLLFIWQCKRLKSKYKKTKANKKPCEYTPTPTQTEFQTITPPTLTGWGVVLVGSFTFRFIFCSRYLDLEGEGIFMEACKWNWNCLKKIEREKAGRGVGKKKKRWRTVIKQVWEKLQVAYRNIFFPSTRPLPFLRFLTRMHTQVLHWFHKKGGEHTHTNTLLQVVIKK